MFDTFAAIKSDESILQVAGSTADSTLFKSLVNEAQRRLLDRGDSSQTVVPIQVCVRRGCVVFPRYVNTVREARMCDGSILIKNQWYEFIERGWYDRCVGYGWTCCDRSLVAHSRVPTYSSIIGTGRTVRVYAQTNADYGKTVTIFGVDNNNQPLMHREAATGEWRDGWVLVLSSPYAETTGYVSRIDRVLKDRTQKPVTMFAWNATDSVLEDLATYDPGEENPSFARYSLNLPPCKDEDGNERLRTITALVKLNHVPVEYDTDLVLISNRTAMKFMMQGIILEWGNNDASAQQKIDKAIAELNYQVRNENFNNQVSVNANSVGCTILNPI